MPNIFKHFLRPQVDEYSFPPADEILVEEDPVQPEEPEEAAAPISSPCRELMISVERASKLSPYPVIPEVRLACSVTESL